jgi:hypothetical protein
MNTADTALATLREPLPDEASRWYKPQKAPPASRLKALVAFLVEDATVRIVKRTASATELVVDTGGGTSLRVRVDRDAIEVRVGPVLLQPDQPPMPHEDYVDAVSSFIEVLQVATGFYVFSDELIGFDAKGVCSSCGIEAFEWQDACESCEAKLHALRQGEDEHDGHAQRVVDVLLRRHMIELASPRGRRNVERNVSLYYAYSGTDADVLHGILMEMEDIAEVFCDAKELQRVLVRIK